MKNERIYKVIGDADDKLLKNCEVHPKATKQQPLWVKFGAVATCVCLVTVVSFVLGQSPLTEKNPTIISSYVTNIPEAMYAAPENGKSFLLTNVETALKETAEKDATNWMYQGNKMKTNVHYLAGYFTKEQFKNFAASNEYGYIFSFATNGDVSAVSADQELAAELLP
jgi:hypothetical protein